MSEEQAGGTCDKGAGYSSVPQGRVEKVGMLDLSRATADDIAKIESIEKVGMIIVPESLQGALAQVPMSKVGATVTIPAGGRPKVLTGQIQMSGDAFSGGQDKDVLVLAGQLLITSPIEHMGYDQLIVAGQMIAPRESEAILTASMTKMSGQTLYYSGKPRFIVGKETLSAAYFELLDEPVTLVIVGKCEFESDVTTELLRSKVQEIAFLGALVADAALVPVLKVLAVAKQGIIEAR